MQDFHCKTSTALRWKSNWFQVHLCTLIAFLLLVEDFWWGNGVKGPRLIPFWCLMPKGEKIRPKQQMDQLPLENFEWEFKNLRILNENFENSRIEFLVCQKSLIVSFVKSWPLVGRMVDYGKRGSFWNLRSISLGTTLFMSQQVCLT
jgi:hypothetical protein